TGEDARRSIIQFSVLSIASCALTGPLSIAIIEVRGGSSSIGRAPDCGSGRCGFNSRLPPQTPFFPSCYFSAVYGLLAWTLRPWTQKIIGNRFTPRNLARPLAGIGLILSFPFLL